MGKEIQAVFFDMGGTIETFNYTRELRLDATAVIQQHLVQAGINLQLDNEQLLEVITSGLGRYKFFSIESKKFFKTCLWHGCCILLILHFI